MKDYGIYVVKRSISITKISTEKYNLIPNKNWSVKEEILKYLEGIASILYSNFICPRSRPTKFQLLGNSF